MGVQGLHSFLSPYGRQVSFSSSNVDYNHHQHQDNPRCRQKQRKVLVIDGPALAYHVWRLASCREGSHRTFSRALKRYIHNLQHNAGFEIEAVYFDGYLPPHKRAVRETRAHANLLRVTHNTGSLIHSTPPPAFAVVLAQDVVCAAGLRTVVTVHEESDAACARHVRTVAQRHKAFGIDKSISQVGAGAGAYLLSFDSDMHCFDLGAGWYVPLDTVACTEDSCTGSAFNYRETKDALGVDILELAMVMGTEGSESVPRPANEAYKLLQKHNVQDVVSQEEIHRVRAQFCICDSDASKVLSQSLSSSSSSSSSLPSTQHVTETTRQMYGRLREAMTSGEFWLPQLLEDYTQASVWQSGQKYRVAAYRLLGRSRTSPVLEFCRRAEAVTGKAVNMALPDPGSVLCATKASIFTLAMNNLTSDLKDRRDSLSTVEFDAFIVQMVGTYTKPAIENTSKRVLHLVARYQAIVFSIMLYLRSFASESVLATDMSDMFDLPTFLVALHLLDAGHLRQSLTRGKETEVQMLLDGLDRTPVPSARTGRRRVPKS